MKHWHQPSLCSPKDALFAPFTPILKKAVDSCSLLLRTEEKPLEGALWCLHQGHFPKPLGHLPSVWGTVCPDGLFSYERPNWFSH